MNRLVSILLLLGVSLWSQPNANSADNPSRFCAVDILIDSGEKPLAAYQAVFSIGDGSGKIVGIEGGESPAFRAAPYYDPKAIQHERVIVAAFCTDKSERLPTGKTRVSTIHLQTSATTKLRFELKIQVAADDQGNPIEVRATAIERQAK